MVKQSYQKLTHREAGKWVKKTGYPAIVKRMEEKKGNKTPNASDFIAVLSEDFYDSGDIGCLSNFAWMCMEEDTGKLGLTLDILDTMVKERL